MNYIQELGSRALGSRLKNFTELLNRDVLQIYKEHHIDFEPRWYTFFLLLSEKGEMSVMDIAKQLNQSHPAVNQVANALEKNRLIVSNKKRQDGRKRFIKLSKKGKLLLDRLIPIWKSVEDATNEFIKESNPDFITDLFKMEQALEKKSIFERIQTQIKNTQYEQIEIIPYLQDLKDHFKSLNYEWLNKYFAIEDLDKKTLSEPQKIIKNKGMIYFARLDEKIVGTVAVIHHQPHVCELSKMAVTEAYQGKHIGRKLLEFSINFATQNNYQKMILFTSPELKKAVDLYKSFGFVTTENTDEIQYNYNRCTIQMELQLQTQPIKK